MDIKIVTETVTIDEVFLFDRCRFNTNNHWGIDGSNRPANYSAVLSSTNTSNWIDGLKTYSKVEIDLTSPHAAWLKQAAAAGVQTGRFSKSYEDELDMLVSTLEKCFKFSKDEKYFVRTENVSLKHGVHGVGPYSNFHDVIESLVTCIPGHSPFDCDPHKIQLYLIPWVNLDPSREYRVFYNNNRITAISQQHLYTVFPDHDHEKDVRIISDFYRGVLKDKLSASFPSGVLDIAILENDSPFFIEINPFGMEYSSGSSLFGWEQDYGLLYGEEGCADILHFRYTIEKKPPQESGPTGIEAKL